MIVTEINFEIECDSETLDTMKDELERVISFLAGSTETSEETLGLLEALQEQLSDD